ncbi:hypothetical protein Glove_372g50 [Diversispora epigaea]|uniref:Uncharacterized protein n=1 Tax=Diversispora epigaea TaxID=1348612 RepID=A0A397H7M8_9GLOM|nr:hypothetical protein Glove_372g50 [Diversispora epigaea]
MTNKYSSKKEGHNNQTVTAMEMTYDEEASREKNKTKKKKFLENAWGSHIRSYRSDLIIIFLIFNVVK